LAKLNPRQVVLGFATKIFNCPDYSLLSQLATSFFRQKRDTPT